MNNSAFGKTIDNVRKHRDSTRVIKGKKRKYLVPEPNYHTTTFFTENLLGLFSKSIRKSIWDFQYYN